ncbi:class II aldolase/adducin family protein [Streptomyces ipomoeae]|uniref:Class II aldolase/adducin family protein n=1 Tax=Streptomyces ipomoeae TaxID=103232 RepID=A0AAE9AWC5_9ACTN|nr:class II aldolase/adducin family protein [Streptomyces ipomoeae]TQE20049.1 class II aldolase/adducin family protein [Streptomyces ipomoeae]
MERSRSTAVTVLDTPTSTKKPARMSDAEWQARLELAPCYRIFDHLGWVEMIFNHITVRVPGEEGHLLINPFGLTYEEVTASNLVKIDLDGNILSDSDWPINEAGLLIHSVIHANRPDAHCIMHTHTTAGTGVACLRGGLDPDNFYSAQLHDMVAYHDFEGITVDPEEKPRLVADLGDRNLMILRNHGLLACGPTVPAAFAALWTLQRACEIQLAAQSSGQPLMPVTLEAAVRSTTESFQMGDRTQAGRTLFDALRRRVDRVAPDYAV